MPHLTNSSNEKFEKVSSEPSVISSSLMTRVHTPHESTPLFKYPKAHYVEFELSDYKFHDWEEEAANRMARWMMKKADDDFLYQLDLDRGLSETFARFLAQDIDEYELRTSPGILSQVLIIERALKNRLCFAIRQKREVYILVSENAIAVDDMDRAKKEALDELLTVVNLVANWKTLILQRFYKAAKSELEADEEQTTPPNKKHDEIKDLDPIFHFPTIDCVSFEIHDDYIASPRPTTMNDSDETVVDDGIEIVSLAEASASSRRLVTNVVKRVCRGRWSLRASRSHASGAEAPQGTNDVISLEKATGSLYTLSSESES
jgi:hypothetical protein